MYRQLNLERTSETISVLQKRIYERFPESGLTNVCKELGAIADETKNSLVTIQRPLYLYTVQQLLNLKWVLQSS